MTRVRIILTGLLLASHAASSSAAGIGPFEMKENVANDAVYQWRTVVKHPRVKMTADPGKISVR